MPHTQSATLVRRVLLIDFFVSGAFGVLLTVAAPALEPWLGLPAPLLRLVGLSLLPFAAAVGWLARQPSPARVAVQAIVAANFAWVGASILLLLVGGVNPTTLGIVFVIVQAIVVGVLGELQYLGLRRINIA